MILFCTGYANRAHNKRIFKINTNTSNICDEPIQSLSDLADAVIANKKLDSNISNFLFTNHSNERINRFNEELTKYLGESITEYMDYKLLLEKYREACSILSVKEDIRSLGGYIYKILKNTFAPEKKRICIDYSNRSREGLLKEWKGAQKKPEKKASYQSFQKTQYDFDKLNEFIMTC